MCVCVCVRACVVLLSSHTVPTPHVNVVGTVHLALCGNLASLYCVQVVLDNPTAQTPVQVTNLCAVWEAVTNVLERNPPLAEECLDRIMTVAVSGFTPSVVVVVQVSLALHAHMLVRSLSLAVSPLQSLPASPPLSLPASSLGLLSLTLLAVLCTRWLRWLC